MTTIAIKDGVLACESKESYGCGMITSWDSQKVILHEDAYYGFCGTSHWVTVVIDTIRNGEKLEELSPDIDLEFIKMPKKGPPTLVSLCNGHLSQESITKNGFAIGSGMPYAMVAMKCGKSATEAVKVAIEFDCFSGGKVKSYSFNKPTKKVKKVEVGVFDDWSEPDDKA